MSNGGDELILRNNSDRVMDLLEYADEGPWPVGPDGSGASLVKRYVHLASQDPASWTTSQLLGGSPGADNFPPYDDTPLSVSLATWDTPLRVLDTGTEPPDNWQSPEFDDSTWPLQAGIFEAGDPQFPPANVGGLAEPGEGLYAYWPLDATSGTVAENQVAGGTEATLERGPAWASDVERGQVLSLDGRNDYVSAGTVPALARQDDFTWSLWFKPGDGVAANAVIAGNRAGGQEDPLQFIKFTPSNFEYYSNGGDPILPYSLSANVWSHLAVVKSGPTLTYYINGETVGQADTQHDAAANPFYLGGNPSVTGEYAVGWIDDVALWTRDLPAEAIAGLAQGVFSPLDAPTVFLDGPLVPDDLPENRTALSAASSAYYFRHHFTFHGDPQQTVLQLSQLVDDGVTYYLNGQEIYRQNLPAGPLTASTPAEAEVTDIGTTGPNSLPTTALIAGDNVLAIEVHQSAAPVRDALFAFQLTALVTPADPNQTVLPQLNEISAGSDADFRVELSNPHEVAIDLTGYQLGGYRIPSGTLEPGGFWTLGRSQLGDRIGEGDELFLLAPDGRQLADSQRVADRLIGRHAAQGDRWFYPTEASFGSTNVFQINQDVVINEIMYHAPGFYVPTLDRLFENDEQWIELYNRSETASVDLSGWQFGSGIDFAFPAGTSLAPDSYLVVASNPAALLRSRPELDAALVLGPFDTNLADAGENIQLWDQHGNLVDEVHYYDSGRWPSEADAGGASLELQDPFSDNSIAEAWAASDESQQVDWQTITYRGSGRSFSNDPTQYHEFLLGLLNDGQVLIDDVRVIENPGTPEARQIIQNGSFQSDALGSEPATWRIIGTQHGQVVADPDDPLNHVLLLTATGPTEHMHNNAGTTLKDGDTYVRLSNSAEYEISFRARWVSGSEQLNSRLYFNRLGRTTRLERPTSVGTPGRVNSRHVENVGPLYDGMLHSPAVPDPQQPVTVAVTAVDNDGIAALTLWYSVAGSAFEQVAMLPGGAGRYEGQIPGQDAGALVQFYVEGRDAAGSTTMFPAAGPASRAMYRVQDGLAAQDARHTLRILMTADDTARLHESTNVMSNDRIGATVIYRESEIFYDVGVRLKGSQRGRDKVVRAGFNLSFDPAHLFRGVHETIGVDRSGSGDEYSQEEIIVRQILNHAGSGPQIYDDLIHVIAPDPRHTGSAMLNMARYNDVFLDSQYENGSQGTAFEYELIYYPTSTIGGVEGLKRPNPDDVRGVAMVDQGDDKEAYRWHWLIKNNRAQNDYSQLMTMLAQFGRRATEDNYHTDVAEVIDVDQWLRSFAVQILTGIGDNYASGAQHNGIFYVRPTDNRVLFLPWDMDFSFTQGQTAPINGQADLQKLIRDPGYERTYYGHVMDIINTTFNEEYISPWIDHFDALVPGQAFFQTFKSYIRARSAFAVGRVEAAIPVVPYAITTPTGLDVGASNQATIEGTAWVDVREIRLAGSEIPLELRWTSESAWQTEIPVEEGTRDWTLEAYDFQGNFVGSQSISVTSTGSSPVRDFLRVTEIQYNPGAAHGTELFIDNDEYEFLELANVGNVSLDLTGVQLVQVQREGEAEGIRFTFGAQTLAPGDTVVIPRNRAAFVSRYGTQRNLAIGQGDPTRLNAFSGQLANGGETLTLLDATGRVIQQFVYDDWYSTTDGEGYSLEIRDPAQADLGAWNVERSWAAAAIWGGSPGQPLARPGDANRDGKFDATDLLLALQGGKYEDGIPDNATWAEGDWNGDGDFDSDDLVLAFIAGGFEGELTAPASDAARNAQPLTSLALKAAAVDELWGKNQAAAG